MYILKIYLEYLIRWRTVNMPLDNINIIIINLH